ncbi:MAG: carboxypeptidase-like regulatory domain-containing protein [Kofleriaceae bacterium]
MSVRHHFLASLAGLAGLAGCAGDFPDQNTPGDGCAVNIVSSPEILVASSTSLVRLAAVAGERRPYGYEWQVTYGGQPIETTPASAASSEIEFIAPTPGIYQVAVRAVPGSNCAALREDLNVRAPDAVLRPYRLRLTPSTDTAAVEDVVITVPSGADFSYGRRALTEAVSTPGAVRLGEAPLPAYLRFTGVGSAEPLAEVAAGADGAFSAPLIAGPHDVLVVPTSDVAPMRFAAWAPARGPLVVVPGVTVSGVVRDAVGPLAGARVSLRVDGVPSTVGVSAGDGTFAVQARTGTSVELTVIPPLGSGLPRLVGSSTSLDLAQSLAIRFADLPRRDLGGLELRRGGAVAPGASVTFVAELPAAGTATAGSAVTLRGVLAVRAQAAANGRLPSTQVVATALSAVLQPAAGEQAVVTLDAAAPPAALDAPPMQQVTGVVTAGGQPAVGAMVALAPQGALALAGAAPRTERTAEDGSYVLPAAPGGSYRARVSDPRFRGAPSSTGLISAGSQPPHALAPGWQLVGALTRPSSLAGAAGVGVAVYCPELLGQPSTQPLSETVTGVDGRFLLVVPDAPACPGS